MRPPEIPADKAQHWCYGELLFTTLLALFVSLKATRPYCGFLALGASWLIELLFEVYQRVSKTGTPSKGDWLAGAIGSYLAYCCYLFGVYSLKL